VCDLNQAIEMQKHLIDTQQSSLPLEVIVVDPEPQPDHHFLSFQDFLNDNGEECPELEINEDDVAFIIPTSGSTGPCKGAVHSHKSARISMIHYAQCGAHNTGLTFVGTRVTHIFCALFDLGIISEGFKAVTVADMTKEKFIATVNKYKVHLLHFLSHKTISIDFSVSSLKCSNLANHSHILSEFCSVSKIVCS